VESSRDLVDGGMTMSSCADDSSTSGISDGVTLHSHLKRRESVARMTWDGLSYLAVLISRLRTSGAPEDPLSCRSRSVPNTMDVRVRTDGRGSLGMPSTNLAPPDVTMDTGGTSNMAADLVDDEVFFDIPPPPYEDVVDAANANTNRVAPLSSARVAPPPHTTVPDPRYLFLFFFFSMKCYAFSLSEWILEHILIYIQNLLSSSIFPEVLMNRTGKATSNQPGLGGTKF